MTPTIGEITIWVHNNFKAQGVNHTVVILFRIKAQDGFGQRYVYIHHSCKVYTNSVHVHANIYNIVYSCLVYYVKYT